MAWEITKKSKFNCENPILIEGLPGIGNVGKIVVDIIIENLKAKKVMDFFSYDLPNSVFVNERNFVELPTISMYHLKIKKQDFLFLTGDAQPANERASYELTQSILDSVKEFNCKEIITLGGIGFSDIPEDPKVYITGNNRNLINEFKKFEVNNLIYGVVGPIIGVSGLLLGMSKKMKIPAIALLSETFGHPMYIGLKSAKKIILVLNKKYSLNVSLDILETEIEEFDEEMRLQEETPEAGVSMKRSKKYSAIQQYRDTNYIG